MNYVAVVAIACGLFFGSFGRGQNSPHSQPESIPAVEKSDWGSSTKYEIGISIGFPELVAGAIGVRNIFGTGIFSKLYWGGFALAGEIEVGWSWQQNGKFKPYVSAFYGGGAWTLLLFPAPYGATFEGQTVGGRYGFVLSDLLVFSLGAGYGWSNSAKDSLVLIPARANSGLVVSATAGISYIF